MAVNPLSIKHWKSRERRNLCGNRAKCGESISLSLTETLDPLYLAIILQLTVDVTRFFALFQLIRSHKLGHTG